MSTVLSKCLPLMCLPVGIGLMLMLVAILRKSRIWLMLTFVVIWISSTPLFADRLMQTLEDLHPHSDTAVLPVADAIFVFGGMLGPRGHSESGVEWNESADRFEKALLLYKAGKASTIVLSGGALVFPGGPDEGQMLQQDAAARAVQAGVVFVTRQTANTEMEASELCRLVAQKGWKKVLIVTSAYHMPRAMRLSAECLATVIPVPVAYLTPDPQTSWAYTRPEYYIPQAKALLVSETALREYMGMFFYAIIHVV